MSKFDWNSIAAQYATVRDARLVRVFPEALRVLRAEGCARLLDYGGGDGRFAASWLSEANGTVVVFDPAPEMRKMASEALSPFGARARVVERTDHLEGTFDAVTLHAVWMCLSTRDACVRCLAECQRLLAPNGVLVASVTHPCFRDRQFATFRTSFDMNDYGREGTPFHVSMFDGEHVIDFTDYHWSLAEMTRQLKETGFGISQMIELSDVDESPWPRSFPWLVIVARRLSGAPIVGPERR